MADETLEWDLSVDADTSGGTRLDAVLGRLENQFEQANRQLVRMELATHKTGAAHGEHARQAEGLRGSFDRLIHQGLEPFLHKAKEIAEFEFIREGTEKLLELPGELAHKVAELGEEMIMAAAKAERFDAAFSNALGRREGTEVQEYIEKIGHHTEFTQHQLKEMNLELAKAGYHGGGLAKATEAMIDLASMSANPQEGAARAMAALERVRTTGRIEARALVPFGINEKTFMGELAKETGMDAKTLKKQMEQGKLDIETTLNSLYTVITHKTGKALGGAGADMETLLSTKLTHLGELPDLYYEKLRKTTGYERLSEQVSKLLDGLDPESPRGKMIFGHLELAFNHIADIMSSVDLAGMIEKGIDMLDLFATEFVDLLSLLPGETGRHAGEIAGRMKERRLAQARQEAQEQAEQEEKAKDAAREKEHSKTTADFYASFPAAERAEAMRKGLYKATDDETPFLFQGIDKAKGEFERAGQEAGSAIEHGTRKALRSNSPSEAFADIGRDAAAGFADGMDDGHDVGHSIEQMGANALAGLGRAAPGAPTIVLHISPQFVIHGAGADVDQLVEQVTSRLVEIVPGAVQSAIEQIALQGGPAS